DGRYVIVHGIVYQMPVTFISIYAPNIDTPSFVQDFLLQLTQYPMPWIIGGDFNCVLDNEIDRRSKNPGKGSLMAKAFSTMMTDYNLVDIWRFCYPTSQVYSFHSRVYNSFSRLDWCLISRSLIPMVKHTEYLPRSISDHSPLILDLNGLKGINTRPRWRLNLLTMPSFLTKIKVALQDYLNLNNGSVSSPSSLWEALKITIRGQIISFSSALSKRRQQECLDLEVELKQLENKFYKTKSDIAKKIAEIQHRLNAISTSKAECSILGSRSRFYAQGDKPAQLFSTALQAAKGFLQVWHWVSTAQGGSLLYPDI
uniref:Endonuclease/exonuclease/phosphatase domain-containing protein n=1 Tax=Latimeria chalumnae TaxID=7897 RepID=H3A490_LATCH